MRKSLIAGNWKMNKTTVETGEFIEKFLDLLPKGHQVEILIIPPYTGLETAGRLLEGKGISLGGQNMHFETAGAFTGEISAQMLLDCGCNYVLLGHSERRTLFNEEDSLINRKLHKALSTGIRPILCVGESLKQHQQGETKQWLTAQLVAGFAGIDAAQVEDIEIAYEPIWAIGTGKTASPAIAQDAIRMIRDWITSNYGKDEAEAVRIIYGGSVKPENTTDLVTQPDIDGALVGGASLDAEAFVQIIKRAS
jgi:triosephosphate isomerase